MALHARRADGAGPSRLRPWITLVVLAEDEFNDGARVPGRPLPSIASHGPAPCSRRPTSCGRGRTCTSTARSAATASIVVRRHGARCCRASRPRSPRIPISPIRASSARASSRRERRLPRVPRARRSRAAASPGSELDPAATPIATHVGVGRLPGPRAEPRTLPYYHRWYFRTGAVGDFEYLVRLLQAAAGRPARRRARHRRPAPRRESSGDHRPATAGVLRLGGALRVPCETLSRRRAEQERERTRTGRSRYPHPFQHGARRARQPGRRLVDAPTPAPRRPRRRSGPADHAAALRRAGTR